MASTDTSKSSVVVQGNSVSRILIPFLAAGLLVWLEPAIGRLAQERPGIVPVVLLSLVVGVLSPGSRRWLVSTLCFAVAIMAFRDVFRALHLPTDLPNNFRESAYIKAYAFGWIVLACLAVAAAIGEAIQPGAVWGRRCYFLAVAVYFTGHGVLGFLKDPTWRSVVMIAIGLVGLVGARMADRLVEPPAEPEPLDDDLQVLAATSTKRSDMLARREWVEKR